MAISLKLLFPKLFKLFSTSPVLLLMNNWNYYLLTILTSPYHKKFTFDIKQRNY